MWTNVFRIGGLQHVSWFQFLPSESDANSLPDKGVRVAQRDGATNLVHSAHLQLQNEGFLSTWTNSFVGPWDPSQGIHNPDEKIKLWLFLPGRHSTVAEGAHAAVSRLRVVGAGLWSAPGDSEEIATALSQALRNCIGRALTALSYMRFGDAFTRCSSFPRNEKHSRRVQPTCEFIFSASEEAIYVHAIISAKHIRALSSDDMDNVLRHHSLNDFGERLPAIVAPHGMRGQVTGCCPSDLVKQVYLSGVSNKGSNRSSVLGLPSHSIGQTSSCQFRGQSCYVEVTLDCSSDKLPSRKSELNQMTSDPSSITERTFIYPPEAVMVPLMHPAFSRSSVKRLWLQNWGGASISELWQLLNFSDSYSFLNGSWCGSNGNTQSNKIQGQHSHNSSSNSNSSSISSISITSSDSDHGTATGPGDLDADADSLTSKRSGVSTNDQFESDGHKMGSKRLRTGGAESFGQTGTLISGTIQEAYKADYSGIEGSNSAVVGEVKLGSHWDWDDDDRGCMDIQTLLSEFGDFGDFFEDDILAFGEPPGTAESQALTFPPSDVGDFSASPCGTGMDVTDPMFLPPLSLPQLDGFNQPVAMDTEETSSKPQEFRKDSLASTYTATPPSLGEYDHLTKAEAVFTFAPEFTAVETPMSDLSVSIFKHPYLPKSHKVDNAHSSSNVYVYGANPPSPPCVEGSTDKHENIPSKIRLDNRRNDLSSTHGSEKYYTHIQSGDRLKLDRRMVSCNSNLISCKGDKLSTLASSFDSSSMAISLQRMKTESTMEGSFLLSLKPVLASESECLMFQAAMCRMRHLSLPSGNVGTAAMRGSSRHIFLDHSPYDMSTKSEAKKKESVPVRIAGDIDGVLDGGTVNTAVGVWRSVGVTKGSKIANSPIDSSLAQPHNIFKDEGVVNCGQRQPLQELIDAIPFLVQHSSSTVDVFLDIGNGDGPYGWLALQEQWRRGFSCGPSMVHAGCGGLLANSHSLDIAGIKLLDPLSAEVHASSVISLLQSDVKAALKSAFGNMDGPLSVIDWCKGRNQSGDALGMAVDGYSPESTASEAKDASSTVTLGGEPISPTQSSTMSSSCPKGGVRSVDRRSSQDIYSSESEQMSHSRLHPTVMALQMPSVLVGYQDDWLKTSASSLQLWEKAPFEPYASPKHMTYYVICPDIDPLTAAAADFFQQLGTVYETCKLGTHSPLIVGGKTDLASGKWSSSGFIHVDCPQSMKKTGTNAPLMGSISDYLVALSKGWDLKTYLNSLSKVLKALKLGPNTYANQKEGRSGPFTVIYVICPFPESVAILRTIIESSAALGSAILSSENRSLLYSQIGKALSCSMAIDETSGSNIFALSGFTVPKVVLQIVSIEAIFEVFRSVVSELALLKDIAFTVYNKARRVGRASSSDMALSPGAPGRSQSSLMQMVSPIPGLWKDCVSSRITGTSGELDAGLRSGAWDNSWQTSRTGGLISEANRGGDFFYQEEIRYLFEPLFILAEPGAGGNVLSMVNLLSDSSGCKAITDDNSGLFGQSGSADLGSVSMLDGSETEVPGSSNQKNPSLHCCYGWTEDWRWLVCIWTDSRGELLDSHIFPFGGISSRQDTKGLQCLFVQILQQGCQILSCSSESGNIKTRDIVITRIGCFYELECQEWQRAIYSVGGNEVKKWPLHLRRSLPDGIASGSNGTSLQQQEISLIQDRTLPSSPSPSLYSPQSKPSSFMKGGMGHTTRKPLLSGGQTESSRGLFQWVQSISLIGVSIDHSLSLISPADMSCVGTQSFNGTSSASYLEGFSPVKALGSTPVSYVLIPSPSMRYLPPMPSQLPMCLTADSPPLAHLLHSKGSAIPLSTGFVVSKAVPTFHKGTSKDEWPSVLAVSLVDYYGGSNISFQDKMARGSNSKAVRSSSIEGRDHEMEIHLVLESAAAELHALSWMTANPSVLERRTALPFHCDIVLRLRRLLHYADKEFCQSPESKLCLSNM